MSRSSPCYIACISMHICREKISLWIGVDDKFKNYEGDFLISIQNHLEWNKGYSSVELGYVLTTITAIVTACNSSNGTKDIMDQPRSL
jgi:hypothetical protein